MMWNWLVGALSVGATIVLYDGSPFQPHHYSMWELAEQLGITVFGTRYGNHLDVLTERVGGLRVSQEYLPVARFSGCLRLEHLDVVL